MNSDFRAQGSRAEIWLYDPIGSDYYGEAISAKAFQRELTALGRVDQINLHINSPGGDVFDGFAIYNQLVAHPAKVVVDVDGLAASIASIIAMSGSEIRMAKNAMMMIHDPQGGAFGSSNEMERVAALLKTIKQNLVNTYTDRTNCDKKKIQDWMSEETWLTSEDALNNGFADAITEPTRMSACFDLKHFRHVPDALHKQMNTAIAQPALDRLGIRIAENSKRLQAYCNT